MTAPLTGAREPLVAAPRAHPHGAQMVAPAIKRALMLVGIVREEDANSVARILDPLNWEQMAAVVVLLAAMVPDDKTVAELTAWVWESHDRIPLVGVAS